MKRKRKIDRELTEDEKLFLEELGEWKDLGRVPEGTMAARLGWDPERLFDVAAGLRKAGLLTVWFEESYELKWTL